MTPTIRLIIAGSRTVDPTDEDIDREVRAIVEAEHGLSEVDDYHGPDGGRGPRYWIAEVICGKARGGDAAGERWATARGIPVHQEPILPADEERWGKYLAPKARNARMAERGTHALCFWDRASNGTTDMHARMGIRSKPSAIVPYAKKRRNPRSKPPETASLPAGAVTDGKKGT